MYIQGDVDAVQPGALRLILSILALVPHARTVTVSELAETLRLSGILVSIRTIQRVMKKLVDECGLVCDTSSKPFEYSWSRRQPLWKSRLVSALDQLLLGLVYMQPGMQGYISEDNPWKLKLRVVDSESVVAVPEMDLPLLALLCEAILDQQLLHISFECSAGQCELDEVCPMGLIYYSGIWFLLVLVRVSSGENFYKPLPLHKILSAAWLRQRMMDVVDFDLDRFDCTVLEPELRWIHWPLEKNDVSFD